MAERIDLPVEGDWDQDATAGALAHDDAAIWRADENAVARWENSPSSYDLSGT